ncbi:MAG: class I SAM-dependent methyltransferase [Polyangiaceae bacterium]
MNRARRYRIRFPANDPHTLAQDEAFFWLDVQGEQRKIRFHDYGDIYQYPGLYEQVFYDRLKCTSPRKVVAILQSALATTGHNLSELRVLDFGAGNGMVGAELASHGVARLVGVDITEHARSASDRDYPGTYDAFVVADLTKLDPGIEEELRTWRFNAMTCVAALGFGDIPPAAFRAAFNLVEDGGWVAFNIKETFLEGREAGGFSRLVKQALTEGWLDMHHLERYRHRISIDGAPLHYFALVGRKAADIPASAVSDD